MTKIQNELCCDPVTEDCRFRKCDNCQNKVIQILEFPNDDESNYKSWGTVVEVGRDKVSLHKTIKKRIFHKLRTMVLKFVEEIVMLYMHHKGRDYHQNNVIKELKRSLTAADILIHVDFAENYTLANIKRKFRASILVVTDHP